MYVRHRQTIRDRERETDRQSETKIQRQTDTDRDKTRERERERNDKDNLFCLTIRYSRYMFISHTTVQCTTR